MTREDARKALALLTKPERESVKDLPGREMEVYLELKLLGAEEVDEAGYPI